MTTALCAVCGSPSPDAYVDHQCGLKLAQRLSQAAGHAEDAEAVIARQTRYGGGGRGGSSEPMPVDLTAADRLAAIDSTIGTWARIVLEETGQTLSPWRVAVGPLCPPSGTRCAHDSCETIRRRWPISPLGMAAQWLATQVHWLRMHPAAAEAFAELHDACAQLGRLVDRPPDRNLVGVCDCGRVLYAARGRSVIQCPKPCGAVWNVEASRDILRRHLGDKLVTAGEAARLAAYLDGDRTQDAIRKLIEGRVRAHALVAHSEIRVEHECDERCEAECETGPTVTPTYRFGEVAAVLAGIQRRRTREVAA